MPKKSNSKSSLMPARKQPLFRQLRATLNREDLTNCLYLTGNPRADRLLDMMLDPAYANLSFGQLCSRAGLSAADVMRFYCQRQLHMGMMRLVQHLPQIMDDVAINAMNRDEPCSRCAGEGNLDGSRCVRCRGSGLVRVMGDLEAVRLVFSINGLVH